MRIKQGHRASLFIYCFQIQCLIPYDLNEGKSHI